MSESQRWALIKARVGPNFFDDKYIYIYSKPMVLLFFYEQKNFIDKPKETEANQQLHQKRVQN